MFLRFEMNLCESYAALMVFQSSPWFCVRTVITDDCAGEWVCIRQLPVNCDVDKLYDIHSITSIQYKDDSYHKKVPNLTKKTT